LAGKPCRNHIDKARVFFSCTGLDEVVNVPEDRGFIEDAVLDPLREDLLAVGFPLDITYRLPTEQLGAEDSAPGPGEQ
jgi:hypothetical protein